jgi:membrane protein required for colicin V production
MNWIDYTILAIVALSTLISLVRGFVKEAISLVVWVCAFFVASNFYSQLAPFLTRIDDQLIRNGVAIAILFIATLITGALVNYLISLLVEKTGLSGTDRVLGVVFGLIRGGLIVAAVLFFIDAFTPLSSSDAWQGSLLIPEFRIVIEWFFEYLRNGSSFLTS